METLLHHVRWVCAALVGAAVVMVTMVTAAAPVAPSPVQTKVHALDGHRVTLDLYPAAGPPRGAAILSHGFTRSRRTLAGHVKALADAGVLVLTLDVPPGMRRHRTGAPRAGAPGAAGRCRTLDALRRLPAKSQDSASIRSHMPERSTAAKKAVADAEKILGL